MYAQLVRIQIQSGKVEEAISIFRDSVIPAARQQKGFKNAYFLVDRSTNTGIGFSVWESEADLSALVDSGFYQEQLAKFAALFAGPPERKVWEVAEQA